MKIRLVPLDDPCQRCGGKLADLAGALLGSSHCHYCGSVVRVTWPQRGAALWGSVERTFTRATAFKRADRQDQASRSLADHLRTAMNDISLLYVHGARDVLQTVSREFAGDEEEFVEACAVIGRALLIKLLAGALPKADSQHALANLVMQQLGAEPWARDAASRELGRLLALAPDLDWRMILGPFRSLPSFRRRTRELVTHASRIVNLVIKFDGVVTDEELRRQQTLQGELKDHIARFPRLPPPTHQRPPARAVIDQLCEDGAWLRRQLGALAPPTALRPGESPLDMALGDLDALVGIETVKQDVKGFVDVLKLKAERRRLALPDADLRFHLAFLGNDGTGQGTVAAILGRICAALGEIDRGHLVETSGEALATREADIDERFAAAAGGVLLVHHALCLRDRDAGTRRTIWQRLVDLAERDRDRLVLVLSDERLLVERLLDEEPRLAQRFRRLHFADYSVVELGRVFERMARQNRYRLSRGARLELLNALSYWVKTEGQLAGNARTLATIFEQTIERQAQRLAVAPSLAGAALTLIRPEDLVLDGISDEVRARTPSSIRTECPRCGRPGRFPTQLLGERIQCRACRHEMFADWGTASDP